VSVLLNLEPFCHVDKPAISEALRLQNSACAEFIGKLSDLGISIEGVGLDQYRREIIGLYVEEKQSEEDEN
jgi:hypothetical protein